MTWEGKAPALLLFTWDPSAALHSAQDDKEQTIQKTADERQFFYLQIYLLLFKIIQTFK
jgi:hypothetical protein